MVHHFLLEEGIVDLKSFVWVNNGLNLYNQLKETDPREEEIPTGLPNNWNLNLNFDLDLKKCHFWIWSQAPNLGKTTFAMNLITKYQAEFWDVFTNFQNQITSRTKIIIFDEFRGRMQISQLNSLCDGTLMIQRKGIPSIKLATKPLVIVLGNKAPETCYREELIPYIEARFNIIRLD